jgi:hypothetical protein
MSLSWPARVYLRLVALAAMGLLAYWLRAWRGPVPADRATLGLMWLLVLLAAVAQQCGRLITLSFSLLLTAQPDEPSGRRGPRALIMTQERGSQPG